MTIASLDVSQYRLPLDPPLTDATHGAMSIFEVIIVDIRTEDGATGSGYTYTAGRAGGAVRSLIEDDFNRCSSVPMPGGSKPCGSASGTRCTTPAGAVR